MTLAEKIVEYYDIVVDSRSIDELRCKCPLHKDRTPSFSINIKTGKWICFKGCGQGPLVTLVSELEDCTKEQAQEKLDNEFLSGGARKRIHNMISDIKDKVKNRLTTGAPEEAGLPDGFVNIVKL